MRGTLLNTPVPQVTITSSASAAVVRPAQPPPRVASLAAALSAAPPSGASSGTAKRALMELGKIASGSSDAWMHSGEGVHVFPSEADLTFWRALIEGPVGSPFEGGIFALTVRLPHDYPFRPPTIRFETPVYHCNVNDSGAICLDILDSSWSPSLSVSKVSPPAPPVPPLATTPLTHQLMLG